MKIFSKNKLLILFSTLLLVNIASAQERSPFEKYDPNERNQNLPQFGNQNNLELSQEQEMQVRELIFQELSLKEQAMDLKKESGLVEYDDTEVLYLGQNEHLKGTAKNKYIIFNSSTNLFKYLDTEKYKKVVTYQERMELEGKMEDNNENN